MPRNAEPFSIHIFMPDGDPEGLRFIERPNRTCRGVVFPRALFPEKKGRVEFSYTGVYVLVGPSQEGELPTIYIGEGDPVGPRLSSHHANKDFWTWAVFFVASSNSLNKAHIQHLESRLVELAHAGRQCKVDNQTIPQRPSLTEPERADAEGFLSDILGIFPLLGLRVFEKPPQRTSTQRLLHLQARGVEARGYDSPQGFVVLRGSQAAADEVPSIHAYMADLRASLISQGVLVPAGDHLEFTDDYAFTSPTTAAGVALGRTENGRTAWKDEHGRTLKQIQEAEAAVSVQPLHLAAQLHAPTILIEGNVPPEGAGGTGPGG